MVQRWPAVPMAAKATARSVEIKIRCRRDNGAIVAAELQDRAREPLGEFRSYSATHRRRTGRRDKRNPWMIDENLADRAPANQHG